MLIEVLESNNGPLVPPHFTPVQTLSRCLNYERSSSESTHIIEVDSPKALHWWPTTISVVDTCPGGFSEEFNMDPSV
jgi:hypothetical protein